jgi:DNA-binding MurR/RpiR family transcriptional regulator
MQEELGDFQQRLEDRLPDLTKSQQRIATYLLAHHDKAAFLPAADMAQRLDVSETTMAQRRSVCLE